MNSVGSTIVTPAIEATFNTHGNHAGSEASVGIQRASQNGHIPTT
jgi:hypothetical protein